MYCQADFAVVAGNWISFPRSATALLCHSHPHWQRTESHNRAFLRSPLHTAHDRIHIAFHPPLLCRLEQDRFTPSILRIQRQSRFSVQPQVVSKKAGALLFLFSWCSQCASDGKSWEWPRRAGHWSE